jgi:hypothetical protein
MDDLQYRLPGTALRLVDAFSGLSAGFWLCERVRFRVAWRSCLHCVTRERAPLRGLSGCVLIGGGEREADEDTERAQQREVFVLDEVCGSGRQQR